MKRPIVPVGVPHMRGRDKIRGLSRADISRHGPPLLRDLQHLAARSRDERIDVNDTYART